MIAYPFFSILYSCRASWKYWAHWHQDSRVDHPDHLTTWQMSTKWTIMYHDNACGSETNGVFDLIQALWQQEKGKHNNDPALKDGAQNKGLNVYATSLQCFQYIVHSNVSLVLVFLIKKGAKIFKLIFIIVLQWQWITYRSKRERDT
jgi:hypothetical protein